MNAIISILFSSVLISCSPLANNLHGRFDQEVIEEVDPEELRILYRKLTLNYGEVYEKAYFDAFPNSFNSFVKTFGNTADDSRNFDPAPLYDESHLYVQAFFNLSSIDKNIYFGKIINVCQGGTWDGDAVNHFQHEMIKMTNQSLEPLCENLAKRTDEEIKSFWLFYFDGPGRPEKLPKNLEQIEKLNEHVYSLMMSAINNG